MFFFTDIIAQGPQARSKPLAGPGGVGSDSFESCLFRYLVEGELLRQGMKFHDGRNDWCSIQYGRHEVAFGSGSSEVRITISDATLIEAASYLYRRGGRSSAAGSTPRTALREV